MHGINIKRIRLSLNSTETIKLKKNNMDITETGTHSETSFTQVRWYNVWDLKTFQIQLFPSFEYFSGRRFISDPETLSMNGLRANN